MFSKYSVILTRGMIHVPRDQRPSKHRTQNTPQMVLTPKILNIQEHIL